MTTDAPPTAGAASEHSASSFSEMERSALPETQDNSGPSLIKQAAPLSNAEIQELYLRMLAEARAERLTRQLAALAR